jgi:hypothetical protein
MDVKNATTGRIVQYVPPSTDHPTANNGATVVPAIVTRVWTNNVLNLTVFADVRDAVPVTSVSHSVKGEPGTWHWHEEAEQVAASQKKAAEAPAADVEKSTTQE